MDPLSIKEQELIIAGCIRNDRKCQERLYKAFFDVLHRMCYRYTNDQDAIISIVNNGMLKVFKNIAKYQATGSFEGWIKRVVFHSLSDYFRSQKNTQIFIPIDMKYDLGYDDHSTVNMQDYMNIIECLPSTTKDVFIKYALEGYTHKEIGELLHIAEGTSKWHLNQARSALKQSINEQKLYI